MDAAFPAAVPCSIGLSWLGRRVSQGQATAAARTDGRACTSDRISPGKRII
jgi:hypothetical protein